MRLFSTLVLVLLLDTLMCFSSPAYATTIFQDDFEGQTVGNTLASCTPPLDVGASYSGIHPSTGNILDGTTNPPGGGASGSAKFVGGTRTSTSDITESMCISSADQTAATGKVVKFNLDAYVVGSTSAGFALDISAFSSTNPAQWWLGRSWNIFLGTTGTLAYYDAIGGYDGGYHNVVGSFRTDTWVPVEVVANYGTLTFQATVDGTNFGGNFAPDAGNNSFNSFAVGRDVLNVSSFIDNVSIQIIPEPSTITLLTTALIGLFCYAWRKRK